jgi:hypothetical protein
MLFAIGARADPPGGSQTEIIVQQMLDWMVRLLLRVSDCRAAGDVDLAHISIRWRIACQRSLANLRKVRHSVRQKVGRPPLRGFHSLRTWSSTGKPVEVVGLRVRSSSGVFGSKTSFTRWSMVDFSRTCRRCVRPRVVAIFQSSELLVMAFLRAASDILPLRSSLIDLDLQFTR